MQAEVPMSMDDWLAFLQQTVARLVDVTVPREALHAVVSAIVPQSLVPTRANAYIILRSRACTSKLMGETLGLQISRLVLAEVAEVPVALVPPGALMLGLKRDLVSTLSLQHRSADTEPSECLTPVKKARRDPTSRREMMTIKTRESLWILENRLAVKRAGQTLLSAEALIESLRDQNFANPVHRDVSEFLVQHQKINRHLLILDGALDRYTTERFFARREAGNWAGLALATDESPPKQPRFSRLEVPDHCPVPRRVSP